mgnify:CR=1 FL=1
MLHQLADRRLADALRTVTEQANGLVTEQYRVLNDELIPALREIGLGGPETPHPDAMYTSYYWNEHTETVYVMLNGGIAGFQNHVQWVIHVPRREM